MRQFLLERMGELKRLAESAEWVEFLPPTT
jgi:hypothetical protein